MTDDNQSRDWPSAEFERVWGEVAASSGTAGDSWHLIEGRVEQSTPLGAIHPGAVEVFVRGADGSPVAAYLRDASGVAVGDRVTLLGKTVPSVVLRDRAGIMHEYPAFIARTMDAPAREASTMGGWIGVGAVALVGIWVAMRIVSRRSTREPLSRIHAVAERAR